MRTLLALWAAVFVAAHIPHLPSSPGDPDSINFALAVREFDVTAVQPHPPGYPLYVGLARLATAGLHRAGDPLNTPHALALVNVAGGALAIVAIFALARALDYDPRRALAAALVASTIPLFWFSAARPLSDVLALALAVGAQACLARAWLAGGRWQAAAGALLAGAAAGIGPMTALLTAPLVIVVLSARHAAAHTKLLALGGLVAGLATWIVPIVVDAGVPAIWAVMTYARESLGAAALAIAALSPPAIASSAYGTFVNPFGHPILAAVVLAGAAVGALVAAAREPRVLTLVALGFLPYAVAALLLHDTLAHRHAVPLVVPIALLFVLPFAYVSARSVLPAAAGVATAGLFVVMPAMQAYASEESPGIALIRDLHRMPRVQETVLAMHRRVAADLARYQAWEPIPPMRTLPSPVDYEWFELAKLWQEGYDGPIWFLADPARTDLRLIDPQRRTLMRQYGWDTRDLTYAGGARATRVDWYFFQRPGWFLGPGWALSPEIRGLTRRDRVEPGQQPAVAWVRRRASPVTMALGGRHMGAESDPPIVVRVSVDGTPVDEWPVAPGPFLFMRPVLPEEMAGGDTYARLEISATWDGDGHAPVSLEQFDLQSIDGAMVAYDQGWSEPEHDVRTGRSWRRPSGEATLWLYNPGRQLTLSILGDGAGEMTVQAAGRELARIPLEGAFTHTITVPAEPLSVARGRIALHFSRAAGLRVYDVRVH